MSREIHVPFCEGLQGKFLRSTHHKQYAFWRGMVADLMETGTYVVPVPGNHEVQCKRCSKTAQVQNENAWRDNMGDLILDPTRFNALLGKAPENFGSSRFHGVATTCSIR